MPPGAAPQASAAPPRRTHRWGLGAFLLVEAVFLISSAVLGFLLFSPGSPSVAALAVALAVPTVLAAGTAV
ncbi:MAG TPA: CPBP family intramembrane glutamate endopeptidase, partial [Pseudonocardia sp.]|nr:CPBP family intramembrane glutamate endopeptidase [Pseudonocardia sp.]